MTNRYLDFEEYLRQGEPQQRERAEAWRVAIGLQAVDGLKTSEYLQETARRNIEGEISIDEARELVKQYYITKTSHDDTEDQEEADIVSGNISKLLQTNAFTYSVAGLAAIHKAIFEGVFKHAGRFRTSENTPSSTPSSTDEKRDNIYTNNVLIIRLIKVIGNEQMSIKQMLDAVGLKDRMNFIEYNLTPAIKDGYVRMLYPDKPRHPKQKYLLTVKGIALFNELTKEQ